MFRLIALYTYFRDLQEARQHLRAPAPVMRIVAGRTGKPANQKSVDTLAA